MQTALPPAFRPLLQWLALLICAGAFGQLLHALAVPAGLFLGPMLVAIVFGVSGAQLHLHRQVFRFGQGCVGLLVAHSVTWAVLVAMAQSWHLMLGATFITVALSALVGLGTVGFGGTVQYLAADGVTWKAAAGVPVKDYVNGAWHSGSVRTDANGAFRFTATAPNPPVTWKAAVDTASAAANPYLQGSSADFRISAVTQQVIKELRELQALLNASF